MYSLVLMTLLSSADAAPAGHGCWGGNGCNGGYSCNGCRGGGHGCRGGGLFSRRRNGCHGCNGGCNGYGCNGGRVYHGCNGGHSCNGGQHQMVEPPPDELKQKGDAPPDTAAAILDVTLPEDAALFINDQPTTSTSAQRRFISPPLPTGRNYQYTLRAEVVRDGQTRSTTQQVTVRAGQRHNVRLEIPQADLARR
jgi:uncharacterized protein (TIGR03000 family)